MASFVPTRTELQVRTHAQKYLAKTQQGLPFPQEVRAFLCFERDRPRERERERCRGMQKASSWAQYLRSSRLKISCTGPAVGTASPEYALDVALLIFRAHVDANVRRAGACCLCDCRAVGTSMAGRPSTLCDGNRPRPFSVPTIRAVEFNPCTGEGKQAICGCSTPAMLR